MSRYAVMGVIAAALGAATLIGPASPTMASARSGDGSDRTAAGAEQTARDGVWYFKAKHSGKCLTVHGASTGRGAAVDQYTCLNRANQRWRVMYTDQWGIAYVINEHSGKCLDVQGGSKASGAKIIQWDCNSRNNQRFHVRNLSGHVALKPKHIATKCLDVPGASQANNKQLVLWKCKNVGNQQFKMVRA
ncbi:RICIN domain-containing protein [Streptomyces sp. NPDC029674]|uniref:RICIN domain-containing protein n=1 Tax=Streptomyces sp. NPDC029674 TaxID=3365297 RepID=UPI00384E1B35